MSDEQPKVEKLALTPEEFGAAIGVSRRTAYRMIARGLVPAIEIAGMLRIRIADAKVYIAGQRPVAPVPIHNSEHKPSHPRAQAGTVGRSTQGTKRRPSCP